MGSYASRMEYNTAFTEGNRDLLWIRQLLQEILNRDKPASELDDLDLKTTIAENNVADSLTKRLLRVAHERHVRRMGCSTSFLAFVPILMFTGCVCVIFLFSLILVCGLRLLSLIFALPCLTLNLKFLLVL